MKAALHNLGCKVNAYETEAMQQILEEAGYEIVPFSEYADVYVINTCSVTNMADRKSRQMLHRAKKQNPDAIVVGAGCYVQTKEAQALVDESIDIVIGNNKKHELVPLLREYEASHRKMACVADINHEKQAYEELSHGRAHPGVYQGAGWLQSVLHILYYSVCERACQKQGASGRLTGDTDAGKKRLPRGGAHRNPSEFLRCGQRGVAAASDRGGT